MPSGTGDFPLVIGHRGAQVQAIHRPSHTPHPQQRSAEVVHSRGQSRARRGGFPRTASPHRLPRVRAFLPAVGLPLGALGGPPTIPPLPQSLEKSPVFWRLFSHNCTRNVAGSAHDLIGPEEERRGEGEPERLGGLEIDDQFEPGGAFDGQVGRFRAPQEAVDVGGHAPRQVVQVRPIG